MNRAAVKTGLARAAASSLAKTLLVFAVAVFNPFHILQWSERHSFEVWEGVFGPSYPGANLRGADNPRGRNALSILYIDEASLAASDTSWPLGFDDHGLILQDICNVAAAGPAAIFIDFTFGGHGPSPQRLTQITGLPEAAATACQGRSRHARLPAPGPPSAPTVAPTPLSPFERYVATVAAITHYALWNTELGCQRDALAKLACIAKYGGVPVIFADAAAVRERGEEPAAESGASAPDPSAPLAALGRIAIAAPVGVSSEGYALIGQPEGGQNRFALTPAALLYAVYCQAHACAQPPRTPAGDWSSAFAAPVYVEWAVGRPDPFTAEAAHLSGLRGAPDCRRGARAVGDAVLRGVEVLAAGLHIGQSRPNCTYAHALAASALDQKGVSTQAVDLALAGKLVLFGGRFREGGDWVASPLLGSVPGIDYHAMALDNLIERGMHYPREAPTVFPALDLNWGKVIELGVVFFTAFGFRVVQITRNDILRGDLAASVLARDARRRWRWLAFLWLAIVAPAVGIAVWLASALGYSPLNWVGVLIAGLPWFPEGLAEWLELLLEKSHILDRLQISPRLLEWSDIEEVTWSAERADGDVAVISPEPDAPARSPAPDGAVLPTESQARSDLEEFTLEGE